MKTKKLNWKEDFKTIIIITTNQMRNERQLNIKSQKNVAQLYAICKMMINFFCIVLMCMCASCAPMKFCSCEPVNLFQLWTIMVNTCCTHFVFRIFAYRLINEFLIENFYLFLSFFFLFGFWFVFDDGAF